MLKGNLKKLLSAAIAAATLLTSTAFAAVPAEMIVDVPSEVIDSLQIPTDDTAAMTALANAINGVDADGNTVTASKDIYGWNIDWKAAAATASVTTDGIQFGTNTNNQGLIRISNGETLSCFDEPFVLKMNNKFLGSAYSIYVGQVSGFGDAADDYYRLTFTMSYSTSKTSVTIQRVKTGETTQKTDPVVGGGWTSFDGYMNFDGTNLTMFKSDGTELTSLTPTSLVSEGKVYINVEGGSAIKLRSISLEKPASEKKYQDFYVALEDIEAADVTTSALSSAGWTVSHEPTYSSPYLVLGGTASLWYDAAKFAGDYTAEMAMSYWGGSVNYYFNYQDDKNYYRIYVPYNNKITLYKCVGGTEMVLTKVETAISSSAKTVRIILENTDDALKIKVNAPQTLEYTDYTDDTKEAIVTTDETTGESNTAEVNSGAPLRSGRFGLKALENSSEKRSMKSCKIYPTAETVPTLNDITFAVYVDDVKVEGTTASKGVVSLAMPTKYAGRLNKVIAALYDNHEMKQVKVLESTDFLVDDKIEVFDTTGCSADAQIGVFMWNTLTSIKPLIQETIINID